MRDPFPATAPFRLGLDQRTRIMIFAHNAQPSPGETSAVVSAQLEIGAQVLPVEVEYLGPLSSTPSITMIIIKLPDGITALTDAQVSITVRGLPSNKAIVTVGPP
jgi:uncharacterized protein (TIGR03437 family)